MNDWREAYIRIRKMNGEKQWLYEEAEDCVLGFRFFLENARLCDYEDSYTWKWQIVLPYMVKLLEQTN
jgi:hypothetical protein